MASTVIETLDVDFADNTIAVLCNDDGGVCGIGTDWIFDALNPACYAAGALPASGAAVPVGGLVNLARDVARAIPRTAAVTAVEVTAYAANSPTFDGKGWVIGGTSTTKRPFAVTKAGIADGRVDEPVLEGFLDFLVMATFRFTQFSSDFGYGVIGAGQDSPTTNVYGAMKLQGTGGNLVASLGNVAVSVGTISLNTLVHAAALFRFDTVAGTSSITPYLNGIAGAATAGPAPTYLNSNQTNTRALLGGQAGLTVASGGLTMYRAMREYVGKSGLDNAAVSALVAKDYAFSIPRFT